MKGLQRIDNHFTVKVVKQEETRAFITSLTEDGIVCTVVKPGMEVSIRDAHQNTEAVMKLTGPVTYPLLVDTRNIVSISKEARDHFAMRNRKGYINAIAILVSSPVSRIVGNFFMGLNKPTVPTQLFTDEKAARKWLCRFKKE